jgi:hypothetical protein
MSAILAAAVLAAGCSNDSPEARPAEPPAEAPPPSPAPLRVARCPAGLEGCRTASGRILYVERVDADGDGDAHFVLASRQGITSPGVSVIDVRKDLRPHPLPGPGDRLSAAGLVQRGRFGQRQIEAVAVEVTR